MASVSFDWEKSWPTISVSRALSASISGAVLARRAASRCSAPLQFVSAMTSGTPSCSVKEAAKAVTGFLAARGVDVSAIKFSTAFGRGVDYYTGFVFELHDTRGKDAQRGKSPLVAGGRYDGLLTRLGASAPIPAVGFAAWIEELAACGGAS